VPRQPRKPKLKSNIVKKKKSVTTTKKQ
jgi:hypothetical protein